MFVKTGRSAALRYLEEARKIVQRIATEQAASIAAAAEICTDSIAAGGWVHLFGTGHSRMAVEEMFPRIGSFVGFHPMVELSVTFYHSVVGANGLRQALFLEKVEGLGEAILASYRFGARDSRLSVHRAVVRTSTANPRVGVLTR